MDKITDFDEYMNYYRNLNLVDKQTIIVEQLKILAGFTNSLCKSIGVNNDLLINKELLDIKKDGYTEDDFAEAVVILVNSVQNSICDFHEKFSDILDHLN